MSSRVDATTMMKRLTKQDTSVGNDRFTDSRLNAFRGASDHSRPTVPRAERRKLGELVRVTAVPAAYFVGTDSQYFLTRESAISWPWIDHFRRLLP